MSTRVRIESFQAIEKLEFEVDGLATIVGRTNIGKSAIVRALECALTGAPGTEFVRHDPNTCARIKKKRKTCSCRALVEIDFGERRIVWEKGDQINEYRVYEGDSKQKYDAVGRGTPEFLEPEFSPVKLGDGAYVLQIGEQFTGPLFLLNQPGSVVADILSDVAQLDEINEATRLVGKDKRDAQQKLKVRQEDLGRIEKDLEGYDGLDKTLADVADLTKRSEDLAGKKDRLERVTRFYTRIKELAPVIKALTQATAKEPPDIEPLDELGRKLRQVVRFLEEASHLTTRIKELSDATENETPDISPLVEKIRVVGVLERMEAVSSVIEELESAETLNIPEVDFGDRLERLTKIDGWLSRILRIKEQLPKWEGVESLKLPDIDALPPKIQKLVTVSRLARRQEELEREIERLTEEAEAATVELDGIQVEIDEIGICPTCNSDLHSGSHAH